MFTETVRDMLRAIGAAMRFAALVRRQGGFANEASARAPVTSEDMRRLHARAEADDAPRTRRETAAASRASAA